MKDVYRFSDLNLAAADAKDSREGMYRFRDVDRINLPIANIETLDQTEVSCYIYTESDTEPVGPLLDRGWVLQERLLPTRVVYFGKNQVLWHCRQVSWSEALASIELCSPPPTPSGQDGQHFIQDIFMGKSSSYEARDSWIQICEQYSRLSLSKPGDKLVAMSGIAGVFGQQKEKDDEYLAGLWKSELPYGLLWYSKKCTRQPPVYQAPSWSWASLNIGVEWPYEYVDQDCCASWIGSTIALCENKAKFGQVTVGCSLTIKAPIIPFEWSALQDEEENYKTRLRIPSLGLVTIHTSIGYQGEFEFLQWDLVEDERNFEAKVALILMKNSTDGIGICGILLLPYSPGHYRRAGFVHTTFFTDNHEQVEALLLDGRLQKEVILV
ncbi:hypothetical protein EKO04_005105 [Ascochyta lentis]|uniref:Heterokaryon incompatibility domain-containing protein n=1 Tax=Ascochyta lentis TaxID=205686 RepID=A0A8H7MJH3_9PLEO|nr:hypothetical protein EKO04_005105 [Ascochyta lentis]